MYILNQWLEGDFLGYLREWQDSVDSQEKYPSGQKRLMTLSQETIEGICITGIIISLTFRF